MTETPTAGRLASKVAVVTGAAQGIGEAIATRLAAEGAQVVVVDLDVGNGQRVAEAVGGLAVSADASSVEAMQGVAASAVETFGRLDAVVANAGVLASGAVGELTGDAWSRGINGNLTTAFATAKAALPHLARSGTASVTLISSVAALSAGPRMSAYTTAKTALVGLTRGLAVDYGRHGIRVNAVCPGWVLTPMASDEIVELARDRGISTEEALALMTQNIPLGRPGRPEDIAAAVSFLLSEDASFISGTTLVVDGAMTAMSVGMLAFRSDDATPLE